MIPQVMTQRLKMRRYWSARLRIQRDRAFPPPATTAVMDAAETEQTPSLNRLTLNLVRNQHRHRPRHGGHRDSSTNRLPRYFPNSPECNGVEPPDLAAALDIESADVPRAATPGPSSHYYDDDNRVVPNGRGRGRAIGTSRDQRIDSARRLRMPPSPNFRSSLPVFASSENSRPSDVP